MIKEFKIPSPGESITEVEIANWMVEDGAFVEQNDELAEVESDKATLMLVAEVSGLISIKAKVGQSVKVGSVAYTIDTSGDVSSANSKKNIEPKATKADNNQETTDNKINKITQPETTNHQVKVTPVAAQIMKENNLDVDDIINGLRRITKSDVNAVLGQKPKTKHHDDDLFSRDAQRTKMTMLRRRLSQRLVSVKNETAMLTTFNEVDMSAVMELRSKMQEQFTQKHGFKLGFMGFFTKAVSIAAGHFPMVNSQIESDEIVTPLYVDVGIAVQSPKGLMVPIVRNTESKTIAQLEHDIKELAQKAQDKKISIEELTGGTISITNGGVFGSLLSTPILNPPQSAILGMHNIVDRPIAINKQVVVRPMMYLALSYDHRIIDGKDSVGFLKLVKELIENPARMLFDGIDPAEKLLV